MKKVLEISNKIWEAMQKGKMDVLVELIHQDALFVHMIRTLSRDEVIAVIKENDIVYKTIGLKKNTVKDMDFTIVLFNTLKLTTKSNEIIKLASLSFTKRI